MCGAIYCEKLLKEGAGHTLGPFAGGAFQFRPFVWLCIMSITEPSMSTAQTCNRSYRSGCECTVSNQASPWGPIDVPRPSARTSCLRVHATTLWLSALVQVHRSTSSGARGRCRQQRLFCFGIPQRPERFLYGLYPRLCPFLCFF